MVHDDREECSFPWMVFTMACEVIFVSHYDELLGCEDCPA